MRGVCWLLAVVLLGSVPGVHVASAQPSTDVLADLASPSPQAAVRQLLTWGSNCAGQLNVPTEVLSDVHQFDAGELHSLALKDGRVSSWGRYGTFAFSCGGSDGGWIAVPSEALTGVTAIAAGGYHSLALREGRVIAWGVGKPGILKVPPLARSRVDAIAAGDDHSLALRDGRVLAWGSDWLGAIDVPGEALSGVDAISAGSSYSLALRDGRVLAWGNDDLSDVPSEALSGVDTIAAGATHSLALKNGKVIAWGNNKWGETDVPREAFSGVDAIAAGAYYSLALKDGKIIAWGRKGPTNPPSDAMSSVGRIAAGANHAMAIVNLEPRLSVTTSPGTSPITGSSQRIATIPHGLVPYEGTADTAVTGTFDVYSKEGQGQGNRANFTPTSSSRSPVQVSVGTGVRLSTTSSTPWTGGAQSLSVSSGTPVYVFATEVGTHDITFSADGKTVIAKYRASTSPAAAHFIQLIPPREQVSWPDYFDLVIKVTDAFGNPVPGQRGVNTLRVTASETVGDPECQLLDRSVTVDRHGIATLRLHVCGLRSGIHTETFEASPAQQQSAIAWQPTYSPPLGMPPPSSLVQVTMGIGKTPPMPPQGIYAKRIPGGVEVFWSPPADDGGSVILAYTATSDPGGKTCETTKLSCVFTDLAPNTTLTFSVQASNSYGSSTRSNSFSMYYELTAPSPPTEIEVTPGDGSALVSWTEPRDSGGLAILEYRVTTSPGSFSCTVPVPAGEGSSRQRCRIDGLSNGTDYYFTVTAANGMGDSLASAQIGPIRPGSVPSPPVNVKIRPERKFVMGSGHMMVRVTVEWSPPKDKGDASISGYRVGIRSGKDFYDANGCRTVQTVCRVLLFADSTEEIAVVAVNRFGQSQLSDVVKVRTPRYQVRVTGSGPSSVNASSLGQSSWLYLNWEVYDPAHSANRFSFDWELSGASTSTIPATGDYVLAPAKGVQRTKSGWSITIGISYRRLDRAVCYSLRSGAQDSVLLSIDWNGVSLGGIDTRNREARISWTLRCSDW